MARWLPITIHARRLALAAALCALASCSEDSSSGAKMRAFQGPTPAGGSPLFVYFPDLDHRILELDPVSGKQGRILYPDVWVPDLEYLSDFAVDRTRMYVLPGGQRQNADPRLLVIDIGSNRVSATISLPPRPERLMWNCRGQLLVGHGAAAAGPAGRLSVVDVRRSKVVKRVGLEGRCLSIAPAGRRAFVVERQMRELELDVAVRFSLAEIDLDAEKISRRRNLPPGARQVVIGPSGWIYVSHASGEGIMATDGTLSALDPENLHTLHRVRIGMVVKRMLSTPRQMVLNMLSATGDVWISLLARDETTLAEFRPNELVGADMALVNDVLHVPLRRGSALFRADLKAKAKPPPLNLRDDARFEDRPGLLRTRMDCHAR